jgi:hypothetical protein
MGQRLILEQLVIKSLLKLGQELMGKAITFFDYAKIYKTL